MKITTFFQHLLPAANYLNVNREKRHTSIPIEVLSVENRLQVKHLHCFDINTSPVGVIFINYN